MSSIELIGLTKRFGDLIAVNELNLTIKDKEFVAILGPSGCGKTTTMNMIAGIEQPASGQIQFDGVDVQNVPARRRGVGFVFQNYAIFTHMSVYKNLSFGLEVTGVPASEIKRRVADMAKLVRLSGRLEWQASRLNVNELQRLALGRSAILGPQIFLLDEPLSNLDAAFRAEMRTELKHLQHQLQQTMVYVTHDQLEAMSMADNIAIMDLGILQQFGSPLEVYNEPANLFVANFMGSPSMNLLPCRITEDGGDILLDFGATGRLMVEDESLLALCKKAPRQDLVYGVRPENVTLRRGENQSGGLSFGVNFVERIGARSIVHLGKADHELKVLEGNQSPTSVGETLDVVAHAGSSHLFDAQSGAAIR